MAIKHQQRGLTLIEVVIVVAIVGILAGVAYPTYTNYIQKSRRADATNILSIINLAEERFFAANGYYAMTLSSLNIPSEAQSGATLGGHYSIAAQFGSTGNNGSYVVTATPVAGKSQAGDDDCKTFTMNQAGVENATGDDTTHCWKK